MTQANERRLQLATLVSTIVYYEAASAGEVAAGEAAAFALGAKPGDGERGLTNPAALVEAARKAGEGDESWREDFMMCGERRLVQLADLLDARCKQAQREAVRRDIAAAQEKAFIARNAAKSAERRAKNGRWF